MHEYSYDSRLGIGCGLLVAIMALARTGVHVVTGSSAHGGIQRTICLAVGVLLGA